MRPMEALKSRAAIGLVTATASMAPAVSSASAAEKNNPLDIPAVPGQVDPIASAATSGWANVGADPLFPGGVQTEREMVNKITSDKANEAMKLMGYTRRERIAIRKAARLGVAKECSRKTGSHFDKMTFGAGRVSLESDVTLTDPDYVTNGLPGFCMSVEVPLKKGEHVSPGGRNATSKNIDLFVPGLCVNVSQENVDYTYSKPKKPAKQKKSLVDVYKIALDEHGKPLPEVPTGTFQFEIRCRQNGKRLVRKVILERNPQPLAACDVPKKGRKANKVTVRELDVLGPEKWAKLSPETQTQNSRLVTIKGKKDKKGRPVLGNRFTFKNQELGPDKKVTVVVTQETKVCPPNTNWVDKNGDKVVQPDECIVPKDDRVGPGANTPGNTNTGSTVGGTVNGGQPGNVLASVPCYDSNRSGVGDGNTTTTDEIMYVWNRNQVDINQDCLVIAEPKV